LIQATDVVAVLADDGGVLCHLGVKDLVGLGLLVEEGRHHLDVLRAVQVARVGSGVEGDAVGASPKAVIEDTIGGCMLNLH